MESLREYVAVGGLLIVFQSDRQLIATVFDWTFGVGVRCETVGVGKTTGTIIPPVTSSFENAVGISLNSGVSPSPRNDTVKPFSLLTCNPPSPLDLSPLFSVPEGKGVVAVIGLDPDHGIGYGRDSWAQVIVHSIVQLSKDPVFIRGVF